MRRCYDRAEHARAVLGDGCELDRSPAYDTELRCILSKLKSSTSSQIFSQILTAHDVCTKSTLCSSRAPNSLRLR